MQGTKKSLFLIFLTVAIDLIGFGIILPLTPLYAKHFGASGTQVALLFAAYSGMQFLLAPTWGRLSDRWGRRPILLTSIAGNAVALLVFAGAQSYIWLLLARLISGVFTANISVAHAYVADITTAENRAKGMGLVGAAFGVGFVVGPFIGAEASTFGYVAPPLVAAGMAALNFLGAWLWLPETRRADHGGAARQSWRRRWSWARAVPGLPSVLGLVFLQILAFSMLEMAFVLFANRRLGFEVRQCGWIFAYIGVVMVIVQGGGIGPLVRRWGERRLVHAGLVLIAAGMLTMPLTPPGGWPYLMVFVTLTALGQALVGPSLTSLLSRRVSDRQQGMVMGISQSLSALARVVGPQVAGVAYDFGTEDTPFWLGGSLMVMAVLAAVLFVDEHATEAAPTQVAPEAG